MSLSIAEANQDANNRHVITPHQRSALIYQRSRQVQLTRHPRQAKTGILSFFAHVLSAVSA